MAFPILSAEDAERDIADIHATVAATDSAAKADATCKAFSSAASSAEPADRVACERIFTLVNSSMTVRDVITILQKDGWVLVRTKGSHRQFHHPVKAGMVTIAGKLGVDMPPGTLSAVMKQAGLKEK